MLLTLELSGGFAPIPGLQRPIRLDTAALPTDAADVVHDLVRRAIDDAAASAVPSSSMTGAADVRYYRLSVEDNDRCRTLVGRDPLGGGAFADLVSRIRSASESECP